MPGTDQPTSQLQITGQGGCRATAARETAGLQRLPAQGTGAGSGHPSQRTTFANWVEAALDATIVVNNAGEILQANTLALELLGYSAAEMIGQPVEVLLPQRAREHHRGQRADFYATPRTRPMASDTELTARRADGSEVPVEISLSPLVTDEGMVVIVAIRDITEREQTAQTLQQSGEHYRLLAENTFDMVIAFGPDLQPRYVSPNIREILGYSVDEYLADHYIGIHPADLPSVEAAVRECEATGQPGRYSYRRQTKAGEWLWLESTVKRYETAAGELGTVIIARDMTARMATEEALRDSEERWRRITEHAADGIMITDPANEYRFIYVNDAACEMLGRPRDAILGRAPEEFIEDRDIPALQARRATLREHGVAHETFQIHRDDGSVFPVETHTVVLPDGMYHTSMRDITPWLEAQEALRTSEARLARAQEVARVGAWEYDLASGSTFWSP
ncbi:MAG: PAS domain S-box protein, partial [Gemmatimonadota bacterium]